MATPRDVLEIRLFGGLSLFFAGEQLPSLPSRHARLLLAWLVLHAGRPQPRPVLADKLWPDLPEARARRRLSHALWQVQDCLGVAGLERSLIVTTTETVLLDADAPYELDVAEFERRLDEVDKQQQLDGAALRNLRRCGELYAGELLAGSYESWVVAEQDRLRQRHVAALGHLVEGCKQRGNFDEALTFARRLTHEAPLHEEAHREVMRLCVLVGQPSQALEQYERVRSVLEEEIGASPSAATIELRDQIERSRDTASTTSRRAPVEQLVSRRLIGRDEQRVTLVDQLERTLAGTVGTVFVEGEPGIGKTELLASMADDARWRGFTVLWGSCSSTDMPYSAIASALSSELDDVRIAQLRAHVEPVWLTEAGRLLPPLARAAAGGLSASAASAALDGEDGATRMRNALTRVVTGLAAIDPVVLILEDAHLADADTLSLLQAIARDPHPGRLLVVMSFRDVEARADDVVWSGLRAVDRDARPVRVRLEPLTAFETAGLLREVLGTPQVPAVFASAIHREGGGNPLYVLELLRALRDEGELGPADSDRLDALSVPVTDDLRAVIGGRLDRLDAAALAVVQLGATLGLVFQVDTLKAGSGLEPRELAVAMGELARRNLIELVGDQCSFTHAATRRVALDSLDDAAAVVLHGTAADALEATHPDQVEALATHLRAAEQPQRALVYLQRAADRAGELHAYATAATHLRAAVEASEQHLVEVADQVHLLLRLESVLDVLGERDEQRAVLEQLDRLVAGEPRQEIEVSLRRATHLGLVDAFVEATNVAEAAVGRSLGGDPSLHGRALTALGRVLGWAGDNERAVTVLGQAVGLLDEASKDAVQARFALGTALRFLQRFSDAEEVLSDALRVAEDELDQVGMVHALGGLADLCAETGRTGEAVERYDRAVSTAARIGLRHREGVGLVNLGTVQLSRGEPAHALVAYDRADEVFRSLGNRRGSAMVQLNRAWLQHRWLGRHDAAARDAALAHAYLTEIGSSGLAAVCDETLAGVARERGRFDDAQRWLDEGFAAARRGNDQRAEVQLIRGQTELALARGAVDEARRLAADGLRTALELGLEEFVADLASLGGLAALAAGDLAAAAAGSDEAVAHLANCADAHRIHHRLGQLAAGRQDDQTLRHHAVTAHELLDAALAQLDDRGRETALGAVAEHAAIVATAARVAPRVVALPMARLEAARGRALEPDELLTVELSLEPIDDTPAARRSQLLFVLDQVHENGAQATVGDLSAALSVSPSTIRRDLRALRAQGHDVTTRGTGTG